VRALLLHKPDAANKQARFKMQPIRRYLFENMEGNGEIMPFTRWDILLSVVVGIALMAALAYSAEVRNGWSQKRVLLVGGVSVFALLTAQNKRVVFGCALALTTFRLGIATLAAQHTVVLLVGSMFTGLTAWLILRDLR
jgi:hypothetical protein